MQIIVELGRRIERAWAKYGFDEAVFPQVALEQLTSHDLVARFDVDEFIDTVLHPVNLPRQYSDDFGQPVMTMYGGQGDFVCEVHFWDDVPATIHNHAFAAAFQVLRGCGVDRAVDFELRHRVNDHLQLGTIQPKKIEFFEAGHCSSFQAGDDLIHQLVHAGRGNVSFVARTQHSAVPYYHYAYPGLRVTQDTRFGRAWTRRKIRLLESLYNANKEHGLRVASAFLASADTETCYHVLYKFAESVSPAELGLLLDSCKGVDPEHLRLLQGVLAEERRIRVLRRMRSSLSETRERFLYSALICGGTKHQTCQLVQSAYPDEDPPRLLAGIGTDGEGIDLAAMFIRGMSREDVRRQHYGRRRPSDARPELDDEQDRRVLEIERAVDSWFAAPGGS